jgi:hypothetical protein
MSAILAVLLAAAPSAIPVEAITTILDAFRSHDVVALPDAHGNEQAHAFLLSLIRDPRFPAQVDDIVVGSGNARYQDVMDRYVRGEEVPDDSLRRAWRDTTAENTSGDLPTHAELFRAVRLANASLPPQQRLRVRLADPPIDWDRVRSPADYTKWREMRPSYAAALIQVEVFAKERRALLVHSILQQQRRNVVFNYEMHDWRAQTVVSLIESATPHRVFTIWGTSDARLAALKADLASWRTPSLAIVRGTALGAADFTDHFWSPPRAALRDGKVVPTPADQWRTLRAEDQFDAVLYLDPESAMTETRLSLLRARLPGDAAQTHRDRRDTPAGGRRTEEALRRRGGEVGRDRSARTHGDVFQPPTSATSASASAGPQPPGS